MKRFSERHQLSTLSELNVTPLLDLAFVLLIIFMITTPLMENSSSLVLPTHKAGPEAVEPPDVETIAIDKDALVTIDKAPVEIAGVENAIANLKANRPALAVQIRAHKELSVQKLVDLMDAVKRAGVTKVGIVSTAPEGAAPSGE
ncbi:MAG: biopolymer transporter ExbD [Chthoniobacteraceae bacterium]|nr:biopolymer transporter ExbD [Chthoniobacteraceae bacterium]